ncbi:MAG: efflux RND transporter periplasmic adaptor subunit [Planctomycetota bacterium]|nr:efflux RND transporter periplasmic adaptor subunit [Planctomycetota bacterium]
MDTSPHVASRSAALRLLVVICLSALVVVAVAVTSYRLGARSAPAGAQAGEAAAEVWTCSMHPQVKLPKPGKCPICFMDLIPLDDDQAADSGPRELQMTAAAAALADIQTTPVQRRFVTHQIRMVGKVDFDETRLANITAWIPGRIDRLYVDYTGVAVRKDDHLFDIYSPELVIAQEELLQAARDLRRSPRNESHQRRVRLSEEKLVLWGLLPRQIDEIKQRDRAMDHVTIYAPTAGIVIDKPVKEGMYVKTGTEVYTIADLQQVWVFLDAYETDVPWLRYGQQLEFTTESHPGELFGGRIAFIDPMLNEKTRTVKIRVNVPNADQRLKPGMFVRAMVKSRLAEGGQVIDEGMAGKWVSPHHPEIVRDGPGKCPICGVELVPAEQLGFVRADSGAEPPLVIPASAPLITGKRAVVYVRLPDRDKFTFEGREVLLGKRAGDFYIVRHGLSEGEQVVTRGNFKIDSALQIAAKPSMMSGQGEAPAAGGGPHDHGPGAPDAPHADHPPADIEVPAVFRKALGPTYEAYLAAAEALADDDLAQARAALQKLAAAVRATKIVALDEADRGRWKTISDAVYFAAAEAADAEDRTDTRAHFRQLSNAMTSLAQSFGHALTRPIYQFRCPMAFDNAGGTWLQGHAQTRNPYFGPAMLTCGTTLATFHPQGPLSSPPAFQSDLQNVIRAYLPLQAALANDDKPASGRAAAELLDAVKRVNVSGLDERARQTWTLARNQFFLALRGDLAAVPIKDMRHRFHTISMTLSAVIDNFDSAVPQPLFKTYCPMAFDNKGAYWLQADQTVANPYFGAEMLRCGTVKRQYVPREAESQEGQR